MSNMRVGLLGFGEVGQTLASDLLTQGVEHLRAWDVQFANAESAPSRAIAATSIVRARNAREAVEHADLIISAVTAAQDWAAADAVANHLQARAFFLDLNSVSPETKRKVAQRVTQSGARYVEAAVMSPIAPRRIASPILLGGPHAAEFLPIARTLGFLGAVAFSEELGCASAAKMCRSVIVKGMEALLTEALLSARRYRVDATVLESLDDLFPGHNWTELSRYMISRSLQHGARRAEEMREVARTVREAGLTPWMSEGCIERQAWAAERHFAANEPSLTALLDRLLLNVDAHAC